MDEPASTVRDELDEAKNLETLQGIKYFERLKPLLARLRHDQSARDRAGNRDLFYDQTCALLLLTFFNPTLKTLHDLEKASRLSQVRKKLGCSSTSDSSWEKRCDCLTRPCWLRSSRNCCCRYPIPPRPTRG